MDASTLRAKLDAEHYIYDDSLITTLLVALQLGRPLLIEGAAGVGKTEIAKVMAAALDRELVRLQCYEGLDEGKALYEWNYQKQLLAIQVSRDLKSPEALTASLFSDGAYVDRSLLQPGDVICFYSGSYGYIGHCGIYIGDGQFIHASSSAGQVVIDSLSEGYYNSHYYGARRIV